eukprot:109577_1
MAYSTDDKAQYNQSIVACSQSHIEQTNEQHTVNNRLRKHGGTVDIPDEIFKSIRTAPTPRLAEMACFKIIAALHENELVCTKEAIHSYYAICLSRGLNNNTAKTTESIAFLMKRSIIGIYRTSSSDVRNDINNVLAEFYGKTERYERSMGVSSLDAQSMTFDDTRGLLRALECPVLPFVDCNMLSRPFDELSSKFKEYQALVQFEVREDQDKIRILKSYYICCFLWIAGRYKM